MWQLDLQRLHHLEQQCHPRIPNSRDSPIELQPSEFKGISNHIPAFRVQGIWSESGFPRGAWRSYPALGRSSRVDPPSSCPHSRALLSRPYCPSPACPSHRDSHATSIRAGAELLLQDPAPPISRRDLTSGRQVSGVVDGHRKGSQELRAAATPSVSRQSSSCRAGEAGRGQNARIQISFPQDAAVTARYSSRSCPSETQGRVACLTSSLFARYPSASALVGGGFPSQRRLQLGTQSLLCAWQVEHQQICWRRSALRQRTSHVRAGPVQPQDSTMNGLPRACPWYEGGEFDSSLVRLWKVARAPLDEALVRQPSPAQLSRFVPALASYEGQSDACVSQPWPDRAEQASRGFR